LSTQKELVFIDLCRPIIFDHPYTINPYTVHSPTIGGPNQLINQTQNGTPLWAMDVMACEVRLFANFKRTDLFLHTHGGSGINSQHL
jgi:hypothetical protein